jgi:type VI secretion system protein ImpL
MLRTYFASLLRLTNIIIILVLVLASVLLWFFGGGLTIGGTTPFASVSVRVWTIVGVFAAFFLITFLRHWLARRANAKLINSMLANDELVSMGSDMSADEIEMIRERFEQALKTLRDNPVDGRKSRNYLFELPWYIIIGPPGTGKTTILRNSGLDFPLAAEGQAAIAGIGGTRNCDWWISNEAVLIDTAGRYTTQDVNQGIDAAAWGGFLELLKQHRRRRPVNGVMLAISMADVALASEADRTKQAETLRQRLRELHRAFGMRLPVYVMFTKCDLIAGFEEYFDGISDAEREQVWGMTLPYDDEQLTFGPLFETGFVDLTGRLEKRLPLKLADERNNSRRCRIYSFPHEFGSLAMVLRGFVSDVFKVNRYEAQPLLRGVFFTSGTQEGTPFDRLLGAMSRSFSLAPSQQLPMSGQGKAFFIKKLLTDVIFTEQNLIGRNSKLERRLAATYAAGYAAVIGLAILLSAYWIWGLNSSLAQVEQARTAAETLETRLAEADQNRSLVNILPALDAARALQESVALPPAWWLTSWLSVDARPSLAPAADETYDNVLKNYLLPALTARIGTQVQLLSSAGDKNNPALREQLETYLMLTTGENYDAEKIRKAFRAEADAAFPLAPDNRDDMVEHMDRLAGLLPAAAQGGSTAGAGAGAASDVVIDQARNRLTETPQATDIYQRMVADAEQRYQLAPISIVNLLGTGVLRADTATRGGTNVVPGIYTKDGFYNFFLLHLPDYIRQSTGTDWVLGGSGMTEGAYDALAKEVVDQYVKDYIAAWRGAVNQVRIIDFETLGRGQLVLQDLSSPQSSLTKLLTTLRDNTNLPLPSLKDVAGATTPGTGAQDQTKTGGTSAGGLAASALAATADAAGNAAVSAALGDQPWPGDAIGEAFRPLTSLVDPANTQNSLAAVQQLFGDLFGAVSTIATAPEPEAAAFDYVSQRAKNPANDSLAQLKVAAATKPEPVRSMVSYVVNRNWELMVKLSHDHVNTVWQQQVVPVCNAVLADRYPFSPDAKEEVALQDFTDLFKPAGTIDKFFTDNVSPFVSVKGHQLVVNPIQDVSIGFSQDALAQLSRAQAIRDAFFGPGGTAMTAKFTIEPTFLDPGALKSSFTLDDTEMVYRHGPVRGQDFTWPSKLDASVARLQITLLDNSTETKESTGAWAIFRMLSASGLSKARGQDQFVFSIQKGDAKASFRLKASSVNNPFNLGLYSSFRCPAAL